MAQGKPQLTATTPIHVDSFIYFHDINKLPTTIINFFYCKSTAGQFSIPGSNFSSVFARKENLTKKRLDMTSYLRQKLQSSFQTSSKDEAGKGDISIDKRDEIERCKIGEMRAIIHEKYPSSAKEVDESMMCRFLRARDLDVDKASAMLLKYLSWRKEFVPNGFISPSEIPNDLAHDKLFMQGHDKTGRPTIVVFACRHKPTTVEEFKRYVTFTLDKICARMPAGHEKFTAIADLEGWGYVNSDIRGYLAALSILQDCYPERLGKLYIIHAPYIFMTAWKMVYPFIDNNTKKKIVFVENKKLQSTLLQDIDESQLPVNFGGKLALVPIRDC